MTRFLTVAAAAAATLALTPATGFAQNVHGYYSATPATAAAKDSFITRTTIWHCGGGTCTAGKAASSRDSIMCELVAQQLGTLTSFTANGTTFDADALGKCNARAK